MTGVFDTIGQIREKNGLLSLYRGLGASLLGVSIYRGLYFGLYETAKTYGNSSAKASDNTYFDKVLLASNVTRVAAFFSHPFDTIRIRL